ncbi:MAG: aspartate dehydrogenase [Methanoregulaceae archaeon]|nr:aspartate dehydrogenase [Methanoregulaceae archaeon]
MITIGLLGCGNIGHIIGKFKGKNWKIIALYDKIPDKGDELAQVTGGTSYHDFEAFLDAEFDLVVEAASVNAVRMYAETILHHKKDLVIMSVGALSNSAFRDVLISAAESEGKRIYIPSGAICGLDNLKVGRISPLSRLLLRTTKSPSSLGIPASEKTLIFKGKAKECIKEFPKNVNVSVALSLAGGKDADVELFVDPSVERNVHEIFAEGDFGDIYIRVSNLPSPDNPSTSYLAALSILSLLNQLDDPLVIGL